MRAEAQVNRKRVQCFSMNQNGQQMNKIGAERIQIHLFEKHEFGR